MNTIQLPPLARRAFLRGLSSALPALALLPRTTGAVKAEPKLPPIRALTRGPRFHWRGYYDKLLFDPGQRFVLANEVDFEGRSPRPDDVLHVGMIDLQDGGFVFQALATSGCSMTPIPTPGAARTPTFSTFPVAGSSRSDISTHRRNIRASGAATPIPAPAPTARRS